MTYILLAGTLSLTQSINQPSIVIALIHICIELSQLLLFLLLMWSPLHTVAGSG